MPHKIKRIFGGGTKPGGTAQSIAWNYGGHIFQACANLGLTAYIVRYLSVQEYGLWILVMSISPTLYLLDMGISSVLVQAYVGALSEGNRERINDLLSTIFWALTMLGSLGVMIFTVIAIGLPGPFKIPREYVHEASIIFVVAALVIQICLPRIALEQLYQASNRFDRINQVQLLGSSIQVVSSVLVLMAGFGVVALALVQLVVSGICLFVLIIALPSCLSEVSLKLSRFKAHLLKPLFAMSRWAFLDNLGMYAFTLVLWSMLGSMGSMREVALFGLATKLPAQLRSLVVRGASVFLPIMSECAVKEDYERLRLTLLRTQKLVFGAILPFVVLGCIFARPLIQVWAGAQYVGAAVVMEWLLVAAFGEAIRYSSDLLLYASGHLKKAALLSFLGSAMSIGAALLVVRQYGAAGVAVAMAVSQILVGGLFAVEACKVSRTSPIDLIRSMLSRLGWPTVLMALEIALILSLRQRMSPALLLLAAVVAGCTYLGLWSARTAMPLYRSQAESSI